MNKLIIVDEDTTKKRIDAYLSENEEYSRMAIQRNIQEWQFKD